MIGYRISYEQFSAKVTQHKSNWMRRADERTQQIIDLGYYEESSSIWSEIKAVYMTLQHNKCMFCERELEGVEVGLIEQDVEHFRPKSRIRNWSNSLDIEATTVPDEGGYYKLAYHLFNYGASCKPCNSTLKRDYFPIHGAYDLSGDDPAPLNDSEQPYLIYPIGDIDADPESLIQFNGVSPYAVSDDPYLKHRALMTIEFFKLDDAIERKILLKQRAMIILVLWGMLDSSEPGSAGLVEQLQAASAPHANCARCFVRLFADNKAQAAVFYQSAVKLISSGS